MSKIPILISVLLLFAGFGFGKQTVAVQAFAISAGATSSETVDSDEPYRSEFFRVQQSPRVTINSVSGDITVIENSELGGVQVDLYVERRFTLWSGTRNLDNYRIIIQQRGDQIFAAVEERQRSRGGRSDIQFHFVVQVPAESSAELRTVSGNISLEGVKGKHFVQNQSGDLIFTNIQGELRAASTSGTIDMAGVEGQIFAKTVSGDIYVETGTGELRVRSISGNIITSDILGTLISGTTSGNIKAGFREVNQGVYLESVSGDIDIDLPAGFGYEITGLAMNFDIRGISQQSISEQRQNFRERKIVLRDGGLPVQLSTVSGQIRITEL